ncbi:MAG: tetratricopeptide repeat protein [Bacteriovoracaceae bacterium]|nr:tetratricopeptide repeat protein [Bacteriovoracaceae bacterium]
MISQIGELYNKGHINGDEEAQVFPAGDWKGISLISEVSLLLNTLAKGETPKVNDDGDKDSTIARISLANKKDEQRKQQKEEIKKEKIKKLEEIEESAQKGEHQEFRFTREEPSQLVDYEALERKFSENAVVEKNKKEEEIFDETLVEKTVVIKRPKINDVDKTQVNSEALKWFKEQEEKKKALEEAKKIEKEEVEAEELEEEINFDESTQFVDRNALAGLKREAKGLEKEIEDERLKELELTEKEDDQEEEVYEEEAPKKKKGISPIVAIAFIAIIWFILDEDPKDKKFEPKFLKITAPITYEIEDSEKAESNFRKGLEAYRRGSYLSRVEACSYFKTSIEYKFKDNPALGFLILTYGELFNDVSNKSQGAAIIFNLIKITRSKVLTDVNIAIGTTLFYANNGKYNSAINLVENFLRVGKPTLKLHSLYLDLAINVGDLTKAKKILTKIKEFPNLPLEAYLAMSKFYTLDERYDLGQKALEEGLQKYPSSVALLLNYSEYLLRAENFKKYSAVLKQVEKLSYEGSPSYYANYLENVGILSAYNKDVKTAAFLFKLALKINDTNRLRSKLASLEVGGGKVAERLILESKALDLMRKSNKLINERKWEEAFKVAIEAVDLDINFLPADLNLARLQIRRGFYESAIDTLLFLRKEYPTNPHVSFTLVKALYEANKIDEAQLEVGGISNSKLRQHPLYESVVGHYYEKAKRYPLAIKFLNQSVSRNPLRDEDYFLMAKIYSRSRQYKESKAKLSEAITLDPLNIDYKSLYAQILFELEGADTAIGYLQSALDTDNKDNPKLMGDIATFYYKNGQLAQFKEMKEKIEKLNTEDPAFYAFLIKAAQIEENMDNVITNAEALLEINPGDVETRMLLGKAYASTKNYRKSLEVLEGVAKRLSTYPGAYYLIAKVYLEMKDYKNALAAAEKEKENNPKIYNGYYILGETLRLLGKFTEATKNLEKSISLDPRNVESLMSLGWIKLNQRNYEIARELYLRAKKQQPAMPEIRKQLGFIYQGIGQSGLAVEEFNTYLKLYPNAPDRSQVENQIRSLSR